MIFGNFNIKTFAYSAVIMALILVNLVIYENQKDYHRIDVLLKNNYTKNEIDGKSYYTKNYMEVQDNLHKIAYTSVKNTLEKRNTNSDRVIVSVHCVDKKEFFYIKSNIDVPDEIICQHCSKYVNKDLIKTFKSQDMMFVDNTEGVGVFEYTFISFGIFTGILSIALISYFVWSATYFFRHNKILRDFRVYNAVQKCVTIILIITTTANLVRYYLIL